MNLRERLSEKSKKELTRSDFIRLKAGESVNVFIVNPANPEYPFNFSFRQHWGYMGENGQNIPHICSYDEYGVCPMCNVFFDARTQFLKDNNVSKELAKNITFPKEINDLAAQRKVYFNVLNEDVEMKVLECSHYVKNSIEKALMEYLNTNKIDCCDLNKGRYIKISVPKDAAKTKIWCTVNVIEEEVSFNEEEKDFIINRTHDLSKIVNTKTPEYLEKVIKGEHKKEETGEEIAKEHSRSMQDIVNEDSELEEVKEVVVPAPQVKPQAPVTIVMPPKLPAAQPKTDAAIASTAATTSSNIMARLRARKENPENV